jgi:hypothetical protein
MGNEPEDAEGEMSEKTLTMPVLGPAKFDNGDGVIHRASRDPAIVYDASRDDKTGVWLYALSLGLNWGTVPRSYNSMCMIFDVPEYLLEQAGNGEDSHA